MYVLVLWLPLVSAIISGLWGRKIGTRGAGRLTSTCIILCWGVSCIILYEVCLNGAATYIQLWKWFDFELLTVSFGLQIDVISSVMLIVVTSVSLLVHIYSTGYMKGDPHVPRFMAYLSLFTFLMIVLVTSDNYLQLFIGWEGVGVCSYLLINFWLTRIRANRAAMKAMLVNRMGDIGVVLAMLLMYREFGTLDFSTLSGLSGTDAPHMTAICLLLLMGAVGKSAQLGLHTWLPDAMEGPTPVSALIHAATMVTAGVYLIIRSGPLFEKSPMALTVVTIIGALTAFFAATTGVVQNDLKKVVAYSTCSQLGYMVMVCGISGYSTSLFHLMNHAFFKALLFLSAGSAIHAIGDEQDMRKMGGLLRAIPITYVSILIGSMSLMGFPYLTGFYSKDLILELIYGRYYIAFAYWLGSVSALLTAFYSMRLVYLTFMTETNARQGSWDNVRESSRAITVPLCILALGSIFVGYIGKEFVLSNVMSPIVANGVKMIPLLFSLLGGSLALFLYVVVAPRGTIWLQGLPIYPFFNSAWQFNHVVNHYVIKNVFKFGHKVTYKVIDRGLLEIVGPEGVSKICIRLSQKISNLQSGLIFHYALTMISFVVGFLYATA
ncbi:NADH dehydrogenase subunit 5 (mitochondrion) [Amphimedon queenslandica]|uniref:NADH-ubiquinone oxidoreductase chain 5 n=2 Tax=Amphimedon queenslandica TaxID=400682 RepID=A2T561_AMPQE|nr:NADH dehydrogenase subunit 5 [Amphimedon queenslandica]ABI48991.1 NADH dehydrogenase subunit 5 [Amphimedon queenslandica]|eukprot:YP_001031202.1 NADH dehydrogenase subunit 5 (mitochondrion) [Amphimedon queenslandica]